MNIQHTWSEAMNAPIINYLHHYEEHDPSEVVHEADSLF